MCFWFVLVDAINGTAGTTVKSLPTKKEGIKQAEQWQLLPAAVGL
jgi:hypothetical protein